MSHPFHSPQLFTKEKQITQPAGMGAAAVTQLSVQDGPLSALLLFPLHSVLLHTFGSSVNLQIMRVFSPAAFDLNRKTHPDLL